MIEVKSDRHGHPSDRPTWRPPPSGTSEQWEALLQDIIGGLSEEQLAAKHRLADERLEMVFEVVFAARHGNVEALNKLRQRWLELEL
ncbi:hypothetical protein EPN90_00685 [Patescibacteria group bacterium]|nr:MAG: hypothetical protein EPN90_00685 [Patescibacteria group bacterium]